MRSVRTVTHVANAFIELGEDLLVRDDERADKIQGADEEVAMPLRNACARLEGQS